MQPLRRKVNIDQTTLVAATPKKGDVGTEGAIAYPNEIWVSLEFLFRHSIRYLCADCGKQGERNRISSFKQMTLKRRDKLVYFRISGEEFEQILKACDAKGARSVSDLARAAVQEFIKDSEKQSEGEMTDFLKRLQKTVDELKQSVQLLLATGIKPEPRRSSDPDSDSYKAPKQTVTQAARK